MILSPRIDPTTMTLSSIDNDLLTEILLHLPSKSLLMFKSVSKTWRNLISDPYFIRNHHDRNSQSVSGIFLYQASFLIYPEYEFIPLKNNINKPPFKSLGIIPDPSGIIIQHSCNGLICCSSFRASQNDRIYYIYNPSTNQYRTLPRPRGIASINPYSSVSLAFDPLKSPHYKLVVIWRSGDNYQIEMYYSEKDSWRLCGDSFTTYDSQGFSKSGVFWNGGLHWILGNSVLCLDVDTTELLSTFPMPDTLDGRGGERRIESFGTSKKRIHVIERYNNKNQLRYLELKTGCSDWNVKYVIDLDVLTNVYPEMVRSYLDTDDWNHYAFSVLGVMEEDNGAASLILHIPSKVALYNLRKNNFTKLKDLSPGIGELGPYLQYRSFDSFQYIETLSCV